MSVTAKELENAQPYQHLKVSNFKNCVKRNLEKTESEKRHSQKTASSKILPFLTCQPPGNKRQKKHHCVEKSFSEVPTFIWLNRQLIGLTHPNSRFPIFTMISKLWLSPDSAANASSYLHLKSTSPPIQGFVAICPNIKSLTEKLSSVWNLCELGILNSGCVSVLFAVGPDSTTMGGSERAPGDHSAVAGRGSWYWGAG